jgi:uncharacterized protein YjbI with pentapeptide repeats
LLATLYGVPDLEDYESQKKNRVAWNRYFAEKLDEETRALLLREKRHSEEELSPFLPNELQQIRENFAKRRGSVTDCYIPTRNSVIDFSGVNFSRGVYFEGYLFSTHSDFKGATFLGRAIFAGATFSLSTSFNAVSFLDAAYFDRATFADGADFEGATFSGTAEFTDTVFADVAVFKGTTFADGAEFGGAIFSDWALFNGASLLGDVEFSGAIFARRTNFDEVVFDASSSFVNSEMKEETTFEGGTFKTEPPRFFGAKLHQGTVWRGITWPPTPKAIKQFINMGTFKRRI